MDKKGKGVSRYSVENFLCHSAEKFRGGILYFCIKFVYRKSLDKWGRGVSRFSVENFLSHSAEILGRGIPYCYSNFGYRKYWVKKGVSRFFPSKYFCFTVPEKFRRGILYCCIKFV